MRTRITSAALILLSLSTLATFSNARATEIRDSESRGPIVKSCFVKLQKDPKSEPVFMNLTVINSGGSLSAIVSQRIHGERTSSMASVEIEGRAIRAGLSTKTNLEDQSLNGGERIILGAMAAHSDPQLRWAFRTGINLKKVRQTQTFYIDPNPNGMGAVAIVEAMDGHGRVLGSFLGGYLISPCH